jgi:hypothetical protein
MASSSSSSSSSRVQAEQLANMHTAAWIKPPAGLLSALLSSVTSLLISLLTTGVFVAAKLGVLLAKHEQTVQDTS